MSFWDNVKKFAQPYSDDEYDDYDEDDDYADDYEEPAEASARRSPRRAPAPAAAPAPEEEEDDFGFAPMSAAPSAAPSTGFNGQVLNMNTSSANKQEVVLFRPGSFNDTSKAADDLRSHRAVIVNMENPLIAKIWADREGSKELLSQVVDLALLSNGMLKGKALADFIQRSENLLK